MMMHMMIQNYFKKWIIEVDRGRLKILQEQPFEFFMLLGTTIFAKILHQSQSERHALQPSIIVQETMKNMDIQFLWCTIAIDLRTVEISHHLLNEIITLWIKIHTLTCSNLSGTIQSSKWNANKGHQRNM